MSYVGNSVQPQTLSTEQINAQAFNGDGVTVAFTLNRPVSNVKDIEVVVDNVQQSLYDGSYSVSGTTLTFSEAPSSGTDNVYVIFRDYPIGTIGIPDDGVTTAKIEDGAVTTAKIEDGAITSAKLASPLTTVTANTVKASGTASSEGKVEFYEDTDNGTNYVAFKAPASIASDVTWTLPNADGSANQVLKTDGSGALGWATPSSGKVLQVVSTTKTDTFSASVSGNSETDLTGLSVSITPSSATSKILVIYNVCGSIDIASRQATCSVILDRAGTSISLADSASDRSRLSIGTTISPADDANNIVAVSGNFLDSPNTTSATTYKIKLRNIGTATANLYCNRTAGDADLNNYRPRTTSTITVMEIAA